MDKNGYVLAMYDIRSKQKFIYQSNRVQEIMGASYIIRDCYKDHLFENAKKATSSEGIYGTWVQDFSRGGKSEESEPVDPFTREGFKEHLEEGYIGEVVYEGGGNFLVIYQDIDTYKKVNYAFTKELFKEIGTLHVLISCIENVDFDDYKADRKRLYSNHKLAEAEQSHMIPYASLPIVQVDQGSSEPIIATTQVAHNSYREVTKSSLAKLTKYKQVQHHDLDAEYDEKHFDDIVHKKGTESLLAVVYIDGNNMGGKAQECIGQFKSYEDCIRELRHFSAKLDNDYIKKPKEAIIKYLETKEMKDGKRRFLIQSGDEIAFVCNARDAYKAIKEYFNSLSEECSSCAGVAIFHSHAPYSEAYRIAEECCESGKQEMRKDMYKHDGVIKNASFIDFHYCQGAIGTSLNDIRSHEVGDLVSKPWLLSQGSASGKYPFSSTGDVEKCAKYLRILARGSVKDLMKAAKAGEVDYQLEIERIWAHAKNKEKEKVGKQGFDFLLDHRKLVYDVVTVYDIWFRNDDNGGAE